MSSTCSICRDEICFNNARCEFHYPVRCCNGSISLEDARKFLPKPLVQELEEKIPEYETPAHQRVYCSNMACLKFVPKIVGNVAMCLNCNEQTCKNCQKQAHLGECTPDDALQQTIDLASREGWARCPNCGLMVERTEGCHHIRCHCHYDFCYFCRESMDLCGGFCDGAWEDAGNALTDLPEGIDFDVMDTIDGLQAEVDNLPPGPVLDQIKQTFQQFLREQIASHQPGAAQDFLVQRLDQF